MPWDPSQSDHSLLAAWASGDQAAASVFVQKYYRHAMVLSLGYCKGDTEQAETATQTFFERLARRLPKLGQEEPAKLQEIGQHFSAYLLTAIKNNVNEQRRSAVHYRTKIIATSPRTKPVAEPPAAETFVREDAIRHVLSFLPESQRTVYRLYLEGYSHQEIAQKIGLKQGQVRGRIDRGNQKLRQHRQLIHQLLKP
ncbi:MAG: sigma-70 family RNA polymerase sigma factor [Saprospiraceae bacterium]|nr:sigma-70 family RNA polymerase sigma factor [Saprospiraceae bacterium]